MNLLYGTIVDLTADEGVLQGRVRVGGALKKVTLELLTDPAPGDTVLVCEGIALARLDPLRKENHVPRNSR